MPDSREATIRLNPSTAGSTHNEEVLGHSKQGSEVEFVVKVPNQTLTATSTAENLYKAVDEVERRIEAQLRKYHDRKVEHR